MVVNLILIAEKLGVMLREQQIEASRSRAILEAVADGVVVTGAGGQITLFNESAKQILGASMSELADKGLEELGSLVGKAGEEWLKTIRSWTSEHSNVHDGHTYAAQINLDNGRVVSIHLAPVIWRTSFLGTVSIFHDITHQAQVDRLKTEFVTNVSHELRTPLTSIKGYADILLMGAAGQLSDQQNHFINVIHENALRLRGLSIICWMSPISRQDKSHSNIRRSTWKIWPTLWQLIYGSWQYRRISPSQYPSKFKPGCLAFMATWPAPGKYCAAWR